jgi:ornithine decarboxylase
VDRHNPKSKYLERPALNERVWTTIHELVRDKASADFPIYLVDLGKVISNWEILRHYLADVSVHFAVKANSNERILGALLARTDARFETSSVREVRLLLALGAAPRTILYSNPCKSRDEVIELYALGIRYLVFESARHLELLVELAPDAEYVMRVNLREHNPEFRDYGPTLGHVAAFARERPDLARRVTGLSFYGEHKLGLWLCEKIIRDHLPSVELVNIGGGLLYDELAVELDLERVEGRFQFFVDMLGAFRERTGVRLLAEPGGAVVNNAVHGLSLVKYVNDTNVFARYYHVDLGPTLGLRRPLRGVYALPVRDAVVKQAKLVDCTSSKALIHTLEDHPEILEGDVVVFPNVGMYSVMFMNDFHLLKRPRYVYLA